MLLADTALAETSPSALPVTCVHGRDSTRSRCGQLSVEVAVEAGVVCGGYSRSWSAAWSGQTPMWSGSSCNSTRFRMPRRLVIARGS